MLYLEFASMIISRRKFIRQGIVLPVIILFKGVLIFLAGQCNLNFCESKIEDGSKKKETSTNAV